MVDNNVDGIDRSGYITRFMNYQYVLPSENKGVTGGRNAGIKQAKGEYLLFLDDDAFLYPENALGLIEEAFEEHPRVKILAHKSINYYTKKIDRNEFPHPDKTRDPDQPFKTYRYVGVAHTIMRELFEELGLYEEDFFYSMEEWDFAYRAINHGYEILYEPRIWVYHKKHKSGRVINWQRFEYDLLNKLKVDYMHLPYKYFLPNALIWILYALIKSRGRARLVKTFTKYRQWRKTAKGKRNPLGREAINYVKACGGNIWSR